ncbi:YaiO family outer membrane beta-barrel protein [Lentiprolixibacter aurantiacus]|uniref:YaiO family outer membrane beta-barrel protein n=1 Tax=Lentiprolixibacter aurantiacus TaxID=2993939 RepID=A0AAE3MKS9_9FLAO|nr:YaiO family outer membrane beta-barrel protein [Lentiprolixibacter aurantiacus]MCX2719585.1 YaiO family outer membrane beta-barrel protein [Lentiprolixibacter aurantiacus]
MKNWVYIIITVMFSCFGLIAQEYAFDGDPDKSFSIAREMAFSGDHQGARDTLQSILKTYPEYTDVRSLLAKTYTWDGAYSEARAQFNRITSRERENREVWMAAVKNEIYAENEHIALGLVNKALVYLPDEATLISLKSDIIHRMKRKQKAASIRSEAEKETDVNIAKNSMEFGNAVDVFDAFYEPMVYASVAYTRQTKIGKLIPRINYSNRFNTNGLQYEIDVYPRLSKKLHGYINYGYSADVIYPTHRAGAELYLNLPSALELSAGMRYLGFTNSSTTILTGSVGLYRGDYYFSLRPYITPTNRQTGFSGNLLGRKYLRNKYHYLGVNLGIGYAPELRQLSANNILLAETLFFIESQQLLLEYQFTSRDEAHRYRANLGITRQEYVPSPGNFFWALSAGMTYQVAF